jgi:hypothetical protein
VGLILASPKRESFKKMLKKYCEGSYIEEESEPESSEAKSSEASLDTELTEDILSPPAGEASEAGSESDSQAGESFHYSGLDVTHAPTAKKRLHPAFSHSTLRCPPLDSLQTVWPVGARCDCLRFALPRCCQEDNFEFFADRNLNFAAYEEKARHSLDDELGVENNAMRFHLYAKAFQTLDFGMLEPGERRQLPVCVEARVKQIYPDSQGLYTGFIGAAAPKAPKG